MRIRSVVGRVVRLPSVAVKRRQQSVARRQMMRLYEQAEPLRPGEKVLFWVPGGYPGILEIEGTLAAALRLRGVEVHAVLCDGAFTACVRRELSDGTPISKWPDLCASCRSGTSAVLDRLAIPYSFIGDFVPEGRRTELRATAHGMTWDSLDDLHQPGLHLQRNVRSSIMRYLKGVPLVGHEDLVAPFSFSALVCAEAADRAIEWFGPSRLFMSHAVYIDWGPALSVSFAKGIPVAAWVPAYLQDRFYFRHIDDPEHSDLTKLSEEAWRQARDAELAPAQEAFLDEYIRDRYENKIGLDMQRVADYTPEIAALRAQYTHRPDRPTWGILAHVSWDAVTDYAPMAYDVFEDWIVDTIEHLVALDDVNWLVKIHPHEAFSNPDNGIERLVERAFPSLPPHVRMIPAKEALNPLAFYQFVDGAVTVYGSAGLEMVLLGKPVILAGEAYYSGKGFTYDGLDIESYREFLAEAGHLPRLSDEQRGLARRFAYTHLLRRQIPLPAIHNPGPRWWEFQFGDRDYWWQFQVSQRQALLPGADAFLDFVCDRLLDGRDFVMGDELVMLAGGGALDGDSS